MRAVVTAGGTREPIDDVRVLTNVSRGRFGVALVAALRARGVEVDLVGSEDALRVLREELGPAPAGVRAHPFRSHADLQRALEEVTRTPPELLFMAAAVADYLPERREGKVRSDQEELVLRLRRAPKLLAGLRQRCGPGTFLIGFKLLSGVPRAELVATARAQVRACRLNLTVANDLAELGAEAHPVTLVTPEGGALRVEGARDTVAAALIEEVLRRRAVTWCRTVAGPLAAAGPGQGEAAALLAWAREAGLFADPAQASLGARDGAGLIVTPRAGEDPAALLRAEVDLEAREVRVSDLTRKASLAAPLHAWFQARAPELASSLLVPRLLGVPAARTRRAWPCGTLEAAAEAEAALGQAALEGRWRGGPFLLALSDHAWLVGLEAGGAARLRREWDEARALHAAHLSALGAQEQGPPGEQVALRPILSPAAQVIGVELALGDPPAVSPWLLPEARGRGSGERVQAALAARGDPLVVHDGCDVLGFYLHRGWRPLERRGALQVLESPLRRPDLQRGASACLVDVPRARVLLGQRRAPPWEGRWSFPGGGLLPGEAPEAAARRELREETGIELPAGISAALARTVHVGTDDGARAFAVTGFCFLLPGAPAPRASAEMAAEWVPLEQALRLPLTPGARRVLEDVADAVRSGIVPPG